MFPTSTLTGLSRRAVLRLIGPLVIAGAAPMAFAQEEDAFSHEIVVERARTLAKADYAPPPPLPPALAALDYDGYRMIRFREKQALWGDAPGGPEVHAYHPGWLFDATVEINEVVDGKARPAAFGAKDFFYFGPAEGIIPENQDLPGVAGFRINGALNAPGRLDEIVSFLGASYFRALGRGNRYGLSARGLAINTATSAEEEFPRFSAFWLERPPEGSDVVTIHALLESPSVTGAYRFVVTPGETTVMDVELRLFFRSAVEQVGIAPLTSMFLFAPNDAGTFDDYRPRVHDSEALMLDTGGARMVRVLNNPPRLANAYFGARSPRAFGLVQRHRDFSDYLDAGAHYELRPSLVVEPVGDWGPGAVRLIEIPSDLEINDNVVAFWVPERDFAAGDSWQTAYRLHWGMEPPIADTDLAQISRTLAGHGGFAGVKPRNDLRKFVIDFEGGPLTELPDSVEVDATTFVSGGTIEGEVLNRVEREDGPIWRLVLEVAAERGATVELKAALTSTERPLSETWVYQWLRDK